MLELTLCSIFKSDLQTPLKSAALGMTKRGADDDGLSLEQTSWAAYNDGRKAAWSFIICLSAKAQPWIALTDSFQ